MKLLALVFLISTFSSLTLTEVVKDFVNSKCSNFFIQSQKRKSIITPTVFSGSQYKQICQRWENKYTFAMLYNTEQRIPVYSAYTYSGPKDLVRNEIWKNEPQLENMNNGPDMKEITNNDVDKFSHQAVNRDYKESNMYTRGHVFPKQYAGNQIQADSTFTLTNIAPQTEHSNGEWEGQVETRMKKVIQENCKPSYSNPTFIVTGVVPGNDWIKIRRNNKNKPEEHGINIPIYYWTAFCCYTDQTTDSGAYLYRQNEPNQKSYERSQMSVDMLNKRLSSLYKQDFKVFSDLCLTSKLVPSNSLI